MARRSVWDKDISFLRQIKYLHDRGYTVLAYDFRCHGESGLGSIPWITQGPEEANDVIAAVDFIASQPEYSGASIGLLSICMGASASTYAYGLPDGLSGRSNIKAMVVVQPVLFATFLEA